MEIKAWGGFLNGKLHFYKWVPAQGGEEHGMWAVFRSKREASMHYEDVRRVTITSEEMPDGLSALPVPEEKE